MNPVFTVGLGVFGFLGVQLIAETNEAPHQFTSAVQFAIREPSVELTQRSRGLIVQEVNHAISELPELRSRKFEVGGSGNQVLFMMNAANDIEKPIHRLVATVISQLDGRVRARGRSLFYRTNLADEPNAAYLEVGSNERRDRIRMIYAQSVSLRELLKEIKLRLRNAHLSYLISGECAEKLVDWNFVDDSDRQGKDIDTVMRDLSLAFSLNLEKSPSGTYVFTSDCSGSSSHLQATKMIPPAFPSVPRHFAVPISARAFPSAHVYVPLLPIGE